MSAPTVRLTVAQTFSPIAWVYDDKTTFSDDACPGECLLQTPVAKLDCANERFSDTATNGRTNLFRALDAAGFRGVA